MVASFPSVRRALASCVICAGLGACTMVGAVPAESPVPRASAPRGPASGSSGSDERSGEVAAVDRRAGSSEGQRVAASVVDVALQSIGTPYRWGGSGENGFDCSGLIQYAYAELGISLPRTSADQIRSGDAVATDPHRLQPGDILGFSDGGGPKTEHVGLYVGDDEFIHSSSTGVRVSSLKNRYWQERLVAARRVVD